VENARFNRAFHDCFGLKRICRLFHCCQQMEIERVRLAKSIRSDRPAQGSFSVFEAGTQPTIFYGTQRNAWSRSPLNQVANDSRSSSLRRPDEQASQRNSVAEKEALECELGHVYIARKAKSHRGGDGIFIAL
jgi:hypothetical protein